MSRGCAAAAVAGWVSSTGPARTVLDDPGPWPAEILAFGDLVVVLDDDAERAQERKAGPTLSTAPRAPRAPRCSSVARLSWPSSCWRGPSAGSPASGCGRRRYRTICAPSRAA